MEIINRVLDREFNIDRTIIGNNSCFLDIETTGLNRSKNIIYLIGILYFDQDKETWTLSQLFTNEKDKEKKLLSATMDLLSNFDRIINYNGNVFDIPFINQRLEHHSIDEYISREKSLDLYALIRSNQKILDLENLKLETIEEYLGIYREDIYSGRDCIRFYRQYVRNGKQELKDRILQHNYDDLYYLPDVVRIIDILREKKTLSFPYKEATINFNLDSIEDSQDFLTIKGSYLSNKEIKAIYYQDKYTFKIGDNKRFEFSIEVDKGLITPEKLSLFIDSQYFPINNIMDTSPYQLPDNIIVLKIENKYLINNIKEVMTSLLENILY